MLNAEPRCAQMSLDALHDLRDATQARASAGDG
jgi:hypothetical protein